MKRPIASDNAVTWRKYAEYLETKLPTEQPDIELGSLPQPTGVTIVGIPVWRCEHLPKDKAVLVGHSGETLAVINNISLEKLGISTWICEDFGQIIKAVHRIRRKFGREPTALWLPKEETKDE